MPKQIAAYVLQPNDDGVIFATYSGKVNYDSLHKNELDALDAIHCGGSALVSSAVASSLRGRTLDREE